MSHVTEENLYFVSWAQISVYTHWPCYLNPLHQWFSTRTDSSPSGPLAVSRITSGYHEEVKGQPLVSTKQRPGRLLNIPQCTGRSLTIVTWPPHQGQAENPRPTSPHLCATRCVCGLLGVPVPCDHVQNCQLLLFPSTFVSCISTIPDVGL